MIRSLCLIFLSTLLLYSLSSADIPKIISYQGRVLDSMGNPVADGTYNMRFRIFDAPTGGSVLWDSNVQSVSVADGIFNVLLGDSPMPALNVAFDDDYWLLVTFSGINQTPRQKLASSGYAYMAGGLVPGTQISGNVIGHVLDIENSSSSNSTNGIRSRTISPGSYAVMGHAQSSWGLSKGVWGQSDSSDGYGVYGLATATAGGAYGVYGECASSHGYGVYGKTTTGINSYAMYAEGEFTALYCISHEGDALIANAEVTIGSSYGVKGESAGGYGIGVYGYASNGIGDGNHGVYGRTDGGGYGVYYSGGLSGSGTKNCVVRTSRGPTLLYCQESPENWFEDFGEGRLANGRCFIELDPLFLETVTIDETNPMKVFIQLIDECNGTRVTRGTTGFEVHELQDGTSDAAFMYRIVAKRKGFEDKRLDYCKAAETDSYLYPELRGKDMRDCRK